MRWHFAEIWETIADAIPDAPALAQGELRRTWRDYEARASRIAAGLAVAGLGRDSKIALYAYNSTAYLEAHFAALKLRGVPVNANYRYTDAELVYLLDNADAEALVFDARFGARIDAIRNRLPRLKLLVEIDDGSGARLDGAVELEVLIADHAAHPRQDYSGDDIYMIYTGGTTGLPKGVMYRQADLSKLLLSGYDFLARPRPTTTDELVGAVRAIQADGAAPRSIPASPLMHGTGLWLGVIAPHQTGGCAVLFRNAHFDAAGLLDLIERERATDVAIVGDAFARPMLNALQAAQAAGRPYDLGALTKIISSGVMFSREVKEGLLAYADVTIIDHMGASEGGMGVSVVSRTEPPGDTARFMANATTKIFDENDREIPPGSDRIGLIGNGGFAPIGYYKDAEKSAATFREIDGHRYSFPGDFARITADGALILLGRGSACINTGGEKVFPEEVEEVIKAHPDVEDCLVVGAPDDRFGQRVVAVLAPRSGASVDQAEILGFCRSRIAGYKIPRQLIIVGQVQRASNGKADYAWASGIVRTTAQPA